MKSTNDPDPPPPDSGSRASPDAAGVARADLAATIGADIASPDAVPGDLGLPSVAARRERLRILRCESSATDASPCSSTVEDRAILFAQEGAPWHTPPGGERDEAIEAVVPGRRRMGLIGS